MRKHRRRSGRYRNLIILVILVILAAAAVLFWSAGAHRRSARSGTEALSQGDGRGGSAAESGGAGTTIVYAQEEPAADSGAGASRSDSSLAAGTLPGPAPDGSLEGAASGDMASSDKGSGTGAESGVSLPPAGSSQTSQASTEEISSGQNDQPRKSELEKGRDYLNSLDRRSPFETEHIIGEQRILYEKEKERRAYLEKREAYRQTLEKDGVWDMFEDSVFLGDSRVVGYDVFGYLPSERVLAEAGDTILAISDRMDSLKELSPRHIFISYGINDIGIGFWPTAEEYAEAFGQEMDRLQEELPDAQIFVNSIIPATEEAVGEISIWGNIPQYSESLRSLCRKKGIPFIDNDQLIRDHSDLYAGDGVHLNKEFYPYWAQNQLLGVYDLKNGRTSEGDLLDETEETGEEGDDSESGQGMTQKQE